MSPKNLSDTTPEDAPSGELTADLAEALITEQGTDIVIPDGYTSIGENAFYNVGLTSVIIPNSVTTIGYSSFEKNDKEIRIYLRSR